MRHFEEEFRMLESNYPIAGDLNLKETWGKTDTLLHTLHSQINCFHKNKDQWRRVILKMETETALEIIKFGAKK